MAGNIRDAARCQALAPPTHPPPPPPRDSMPHAPERRSTMRAICGLRQLARRLSRSEAARRGQWRRPAAGRGIRSGRRGPAAAAAASTHRSTCPPQVQQHLTVAPPRIWDERPRDHSGQAVGRALGIPGEGRCRPRWGLRGPRVRPQAERGVTGAALTRQAHAGGLVVPRHRADRYVAMSWPCGSSTTAVSQIVDETRPPRPRPMAQPMATP